MEVVDYIEKTQTPRILTSPSSAPSATGGAAPESLCHASLWPAYSRPACKVSLISGRYAEVDQLCANEALEKESRFRCLPEFFNVFGASSATVRWRTMRVRCARA